MNRLCRANVDTSVAANLLIAAMRAEFLFVSKEARLLKLTHQFTHLEQSGRIGHHENNLAAKRVG